MATAHFVCVYLFIFQFFSYFGLEAPNHLSNTRGGSQYKGERYDVCRLRAERHRTVTQVRLPSSLSWHVCRTNFARKTFFLSYEFSYEICADNLPRKCWAFICDSKKIPQIPANISLRKIKKSPTSFCRGAGRTLRSGKIKGQQLKGKIVS